MYDHLLGEIIDKQTSRAVVRCAGVGYELRISLSTASELKVGSTGIVYTLLHVVDGTPSLLGFATRAERELARRLLSVSGIGPTIALALLSVLAPEDLAHAIARGDTAALKAVKGVGQKTAERLCLELRDAVQKLDLSAGDGPVRPRADQSTDDAIAALITLGYSDKDARDKVEKVRRSATAPAAGDTEALVKAVLQS
ncbi:MAG: Holliday junction branch migration protein RuvA [Planctomycetes bacterium]|nr:Holliday junction branch migration protein RuvA [Planctomycetota bacterium]